MKKNISVGTFWIVLILCILIISPVCIFIGKKLADGENNNSKVSENNETNDSKKEDNSLNKDYEDIIDDLVSSNKFLFPDSCVDEYSYGIDFESKFYTNGISLNEFSKEDLITAAFYEIENIPVCNEEKAHISLEEINNALKKKFNESGLEITLEDLKKYEGENLNFEFDDENIYVSSNNCDGCGVGPQPFYEKNIEKYELVGNNIYIYYYAAYFDEYYLDDEEMKYDVYKPTDIEYIYNGDFVETKYKNKIEELENSEDITWSKYTLYKATYELIAEELYFRANEIIKN